MRVFQGEQFGPVYSIDIGAMTMIVTMPFVFNGIQRQQMKKTVAYGHKIYGHNSILGREETLILNRINRFAGCNNFLVFTGFVAYVVRTQTTNTLNEKKKLQQQHQQNLDTPRGVLINARKKAHTEEREKERERFESTVIYPKMVLYRSCFCPFLVYDIHFSDIFVLRYYIGFVSASASAYLPTCLCVYSLKVIAIANSELKDHCCWATFHQFCVRVQFRVYLLNSRSASLICTRSDNYSAQ